jgi:hypothetical protein
MIKIIIENGTDVCNFQSIEDALKYLRTINEVRGYEKRYYAMMLEKCEHGNYLHGNDNKCCKDDTAAVSYNPKFEEDLRQDTVPDFFYKQAMKNNNKPIEEFSIFGWKYRLVK